MANLGDAHAPPSKKIAPCDEKVLSVLSLNPEFKKALYNMLFYNTYLFFIIYLS